MSFVCKTETDEFSKKMNECSLVITHAGTGVIVNAVKKEIKVIAVPAADA